MIRDTQTLIYSLAGKLEPIRPLPRPWIRTAVWLALSATYIAIVLIEVMPWHGLRLKMPDPRFAFEQAFALTAGIAAAAAAFTTVVPGYDRRLLALVLLPLAGWLGCLGEACVQEFFRFGPQGVPLKHDLSCFPFIVLLGTFPAIAMAVMLRRGAPLTPRLTAAFGGLAAAGLGNFGLRLVHPEDVSLMLLVWHLGGVFALSAFAGSAGCSILNWRSVTGASRSTAR